MPSSSLGAGPILFPPLLLLSGGQIAMYFASLSARCLARSPSDPPKRKLDRSSSRSLLVRSFCASVSLNSAARVSSRDALGPERCHPICCSRVNCSGLRIDFSLASPSACIFWKYAVQPFFRHRPKIDAGIEHRVSTFFVRLLDFGLLLWSDANPADGVFA